MPTKAFLHKKSLLDQFKDDYKSTGYIQSARAEHTWSNPLTRRKRTNKLNGWIKSFQGKRHVRKLARFNAMQNENLEEAMSLKGFLSNISDKLVNKYGLDKNKVQNYLGSHTQEMQELLDDKELSLKEKAEFVRSEITGEKDEAKKSERLFNKRKMERIALSEGSKVSPYLVEIAHKILTDEYGWKASTIEEVADWLGDHKQAFEHAYGQALRSSDDDTANVRAGIEAALDEEETGVMNAEIAMMGEGKEMDNRSKVCRENATWVADQIKDLTEGLPVSLKELSVNTDPDDYYVKYEMTINGKPYEFYSGDDDFTIVDPTNHHEVNGGLSLAYAGNLDLIKFCDELTGGANEAKDDLAGYKSYSFKSDTDDVQANKKEADKVLSEFAEDVKDNTTFEFKYDWYDKSYKVIDTETNSVFQTGKFLFKKFAENKLYLDDGVIDKPAGMKLQVWMAVCKQNEAKEPAEEKLGYEKGHKNSKGEDAPWVIRSHKDNRVLASFPTKKEAEDQMQRMKQYSKTESKQNEMNNHELTAAVQKAADSAGAKVKIEPAGALFLEVYMENKNHVLERAWYVDEVEQTITPFEFNFETTEWNTGDTKSYSNSDELTAVMTDFFKDAQSELFEAKKSEADGDTDVFTIDLYRIDDDGEENSIDDMQASQIIYDEDEAIKVANELADSYADDDGVVFAVVMAGEREKPNGDIVGEPFDIHWASSGNPEKTAEYRKKAGYATFDNAMDYYAKKTESSDDDLRSRMKKIGYDLLENGNLHSWEYDFIKECLDFSEFKKLEQYLIRKGWYNSPTESKKSEDTVDDYAKRLKSGERIEDIIQQIKDAPDPKIGTFYTEKELGILKNVFKQYVEDVSKIKYSVPSDYKISYDIQETPTNDFYAVVKATRDDGDTIYLCNVAGEVVYDYNTPKQFKCSVGEVSPKGGGEMVGHYIVRPQSAFLDDEFYGKDNPRFYLKSTEIDDIDDHFKKVFKKKSSKAPTEGFSLELEDTLQVPEWLWKAYMLDDTTDLEEDEIEKLNDFREKYKDYHLDDKSEDPYFSSRNDFDELGGNVYDVDAYKMSDKPTEKKSESKNEALKDFPDGTNYKFTFGFYSPKTANIAKDAAEKNGYVAISDKDNNVSIWTKDPQDAIRFADAIVNLSNEDERTKLERSDVDKAFAIAIKNKDYSENKETIDNATAEYAVVVHPFESFDGFSVMGELTDVVDFLEAVK